MSQLGSFAEPLSRSNIRDLASSLREAFGMKNQPYADVGRLMEFVLPQVMEGYEFQVRTMVEMGSSHGLTSPDERRIILREDVYDGLCEGKGRDRYTAAHELGHLVMHSNGRVMLRRGEEKPVTYCNPEWQANCFAGEFLMPFDLVKGFVSPAEISTKCGVSSEAARVQWEIMQRSK
jgi:Zn-dependent peptidase ImmA (M78 family)